MKIAQYFFSFFIFHFFIIFYLESKEKLKVFQHRHSNEANFSKYWLNYIYDTYDCEITIDPYLKDIQNNSLVVIEDINFSGKKKINLINQLKNKNLLIIQLSDEFYKTEWNLYENSFATFREYFANKPDPKRKINFLPLACKTGFITEIPFENLPKTSEREFIWSFIGQVKKSNREIMYHYLLDLNLPHSKHFNSNFDSKDCLSTSEYQQILKKTLFSPCPKGWSNDESFRLYESLECGCIPIVEKGNFDYYRSYFGKVPFIVLDDWKDLKNAVLPLLQNERALEIMRKDCYLWWQKIKQVKKQELKMKIDEFLKFENNQNQNSNFFEGTKQT